MRGVFNDKVTDKIILKARKLPFHWQSSHRSGENLETIMESER
jgi:hypothetical protein